MRKIAVGTMALLVVAFGAHLALAGSNRVYTSGPSGFGCAFVTVSTPKDTISCTWNNNLLPLPPKYSVDTLASYTDVGGVGTLSVDLDFDAVAQGGGTTTVLIPLSAFPADPDLDTNTDILLSVVLRVKALSPPGKSQNNTFSSGTVTCTIGAGCV
jgi:hypothetical protein